MRTTIFHALALLACFAFACTGDDAEDSTTLADTEATGSESTDTSDSTETDTGDTGEEMLTCVPDEGLQILDLEVGTGQEVMVGDNLTVHYTGWLCEDGMRGTEFDSSVNGMPFSFQVGIGQVIMGWDMGVPGMRVGGKRELVIPPELAYGQQGAGGGIIPPNATLNFEVEVLSVP